MTRRSLMKNTDQRPLFSEYAPYEAFWEGFVDYRHGLYRNPYDSVPFRVSNPKLGIEARKRGHACHAGNRELITNVAAVKVPPLAVASKVSIPLHPKNN